MFLWYAGQKALKRSGWACWGTFPESLFVKKRKVSMGVVLTIGFGRHCESGKLAALHAPAPLGVKACLGKSAIAKHMRTCVPGSWQLLGKHGVFWILKVMGCRLPKEVRLNKRDFWPWAVHKEFAVLPLTVRGKILPPQILWVPLYPGGGKEPHLPLLSSSRYSPWSAGQVARWMCLGFPQHLTFCLHHRLL